MEFKRKCICGCERSFWPSRKDQVYLETACRNRVNNGNYSIRMAPYRKIMDFAIEQDFILEGLYKPDAEVLISLPELSNRKIFPEKANQIFYNDKNQITKFCFVKFGCQQIKQNLFKIFNYENNNV